MKEESKFVTQEEALNFILLKFNNYAYVLKA